MLSRAAQADMAAVSASDIPSAAALCYAGDNTAHSDMTAHSKMALLIRTGTNGHRPKGIKRINIKHTH